MDPDQRMFKLVEAYHLIFDAKDSFPPGSGGAYDCHEALTDLRRLLTDLEGYGTVPRRFDGEGRAEGDSLIVTHEDAGEILGALSAMAQIAAAVVDPIASAHWQALYGKYATQVSS